MPVQHASEEAIAHENDVSPGGGHHAPARHPPAKLSNADSHGGIGGNHWTLKRGHSENSIILWSGIVIVSGILLILLQLSLEAFYLYRHDIRQFGSSSYIGLTVVEIGAILMAVTLLAGRWRSAGARSEAE